MKAKNKIVEIDSGSPKHHLMLRCEICGHVFEATITDTLCPKWKGHNAESDKSDSSDSFDAYNSRNTHF